MRMYASATVRADDTVTLFDTGRVDVVSIAFGDSVNAEQVTLYFDDPAVLDRLAAAATAGAVSLRAKLEALEAGDDDRPVEPAAS